MASIASTNLFDLLGNDPDLDPDREPEPPTKAIDKPVQRTGKRNAGGEAPPRGGQRGGRGGGRHEYTGNEQAFRDRGAGSYQNRSRAPDDGLRQDRHPDRLRRPDDHRDGDGRPRGSRGGRGYGGRGARPPRDDRHSRTGVTDHDKQVAHGWGGQTGEGEWAEEKAGEAIAKEDEKQGVGATVETAANPEGFTPDASRGWEGDAPAGGDESSAPAKQEPEEKTKSYSDYLAEQAEKKLHLGSGPLEVRKPNEGSAKRFPEGKALNRDEDDDAYIQGASGKRARDRPRKERHHVELDDARLHSAPRESYGRGGRGRGRGRGGDFESRGRGGRGRGGFRGDREQRGPQSPNVDDESAFPSLGS